MQLHVSAIQVGEDRRRLEQICHLTGNGKPPTACRKCKLEATHRKSSLSLSSQEHILRSYSTFWFSLHSSYSICILQRSLCPFIHRLEFCARPSGIIRGSFPFFAQKMHTNSSRPSVVVVVGVSPPVAVGSSREVNAKEKEKKSKKQRLYATLATPPSIKHRQLRPVHVSHKAAPHLGSEYGCP